MELIKRALYCAGGLPLALEIIGSNFVDKTLDEEWDSVLKTYERFPNRDIQEILRVSYDSLDTNEREIFLDIACFFSGYTLRDVTNMLEARGFQPKFGIRVLQEKSLINIDSFSRKCNDQIMIMHDLVRSMGKEMVREQSNFPEKRNRLWFCEDIVRALDKNTENEIEVMMLDMPKDLKVQWNQTVYRKMKNLQMMLVKSSVASLRMPKDLPNSLRVLEWWGYPGASLPSNFHLKNLVILNLSYSCFRWDKPLENSKMLRQLVLKGCKNIRRVPDMSGFPNLTELCLADCTNLIKIHDSLGFLHNLRWLCAEGCTKLVIFPRRIKLTSLEHLCIKDCSSLVMLPEILAPMQKLKYVDLDGTSIKNLPRSMQNLKGLQILSMNRCKMLEINGRSNVVQMLPKLFPYLKELWLDESSLTIIPACIEECHSLDYLSLYNCKKLREIRGLPPNMTRLSAENSLVEVDSSTLNMLVRRAINSSGIRLYALPGHQVPEWFDHSTYGNSLRFWFRNKLPSFTVCGGVLGVCENTELRFVLKLIYLVRINDVHVRVSSPASVYIDWRDVENDHVLMFNLESFFKHPMDNHSRRTINTNEWIYGSISFVITPSENDSLRLELIKCIGVHVNRAFCRMEDVRFTDPYPPNTNNTRHVGNQLLLPGEEPDIQVKNQSLALLKPYQIGEQPLNYESSNSDSQVCTIHYPNGQGSERTEILEVSIDEAAISCQNKEVVMVEACEGNKKNDANMQDGHHMAAGELDQLAEAYANPSEHQHGEIMKQAPPISQDATPFLPQYIADSETKRKAPTSEISIEKVVKKIRTDQEMLFNNVATLQERQNQFFHWFNTEVLPIFAPTARPFPSTGSTISSGQSSQSKKIEEKKGEN
ncbi:disease resistance protein RML1B isoform X2 [Cajanus cajan]|uniref:disease resistance protein RML1B isoform X2 n=1 Tax=Cajanus cajan TaxID=3821 RepID=UPI0010FB8F3F|nr:disease resistance protein RML1B isoform X2 [Cajanus cajan]